MCVQRDDLSAVVQTQCLGPKTKESSERGSPVLGPLWCRCSTGVSLPNKKKGLKQKQTWSCTTSVAVVVLHFLGHILSQSDKANSVV